MEEKIAGKMYYGFELIEKRDLYDIKSTGFLFEHKKSGAKLLYVSNDDENKVFSISFRTPCSDSTGVSHILEHSVLCGSRKYRVKEPFVELLKGSLNTYLNAMTFLDKTMYPIASCNDKDFINLIDVYMDSVFYPLIYDRQEIFLQEGWHYQLENTDGALKYGGVVYNEMKGAYSSAEKVLDRAITESLFPDNQYVYESGGDPKVVPDLSYEQFLDFHKKYYHPSNSYIYFYGNGNIDTHLKYLDTNYLSNFDTAQVDSHIDFQKPFEKSTEIQKVYSIASEESERDKTYFALSFAIGTTESAENVLAIDILNFILMMTPASPLKKAILDETIGKNVYGYSNSNIRQPIYSIVVENTNSECKQKFKSTVYDTLENIVKNGLDKKLVEGAVNVFEFIMREADYGSRPKGLTYNVQAMASWIYGDDPMKFMQFSQYFENIKSDNRYFEKFIDRYILKNNHSSLVSVVPEKGLENQIEVELSKKLEDYKKSLSSDELNCIVENYKKLKLYHEISDTRENLNKIPILEIEDIDRCIKELPIQVLQKDDYKLLLHIMDTNKIVYTNLIFDSTTVPQSMIPYIGLLAHIIGEVSTQNYSYEELTKELSIYTGGVVFSPEVYCSRDGNYYPKFVVSSKVLIDKLPKMLELLKEMINNTVYTEDKRIKEILQEYKSNLLSTLLSRGNLTASKRACSNIFQAKMYEEYISNISHYEFLCDLENKIETDIESIKQKLVDTANYIFNRQNLILSVATNQENEKLVQTEFEKFASNLKNEKFKSNIYNFEKHYNREAFLTASKVQYVAKAVDYKKAGYNFDGSMFVLKTILDLDYLWNEVRVKGGAYGVSIVIRYEGYMFIVSYRDPNIVNTLNSYDSIGNYIDRFDADERDMRKYIIGTISSLDMPMSSATKAKVAAIRYITGVSHQTLQKDRDEILNTDISKIKSYSNMLKDIMSQNNIAVIGNENNINQNSKLFDNLNTVFQN